jgi:hypothetical protein
LDWVYGAWNAWDARFDLRCMVACDVLSCVNLWDSLRTTEVVGRSGNDNVFVALMSGSGD